MTVAVKEDGITDVAAQLERHFAWLESSGELGERRRRRTRERTREVVERAARRWIWDDTEARQLIDSRLDDLMAGRTNPYEVATEVLDELRQGSST